MIYGSDIYMEQKPRADCVFTAERTFSVKKSRLEHKVKNFLEVKLLLLGP